MPRCSAMNGSPFGIGIVVPSTCLPSVRTHRVRSRLCASALSGHGAPRFEAGLTRRARALATSSASPSSMRGVGIRAACRFVSGPAVVGLRRSGLRSCRGRDGFERGASRRRMRRSRADDVDGDEQGDHGQRRDDRDASDALRRPAPAWTYRSIGGGLGVRGGQGHEVSRESRRRRFADAIGGADRVPVDDIDHLGSRLRITIRLADVKSPLVR